MRQVVSSRGSGSVTGKPERPLRGCGPTGGGVWAGPRWRATAQRGRSLGLPGRTVRSPRTDPRPFAWWRDSAAGPGLSGRRRNHGARVRRPDGSLSISEEQREPKLSLRPRTSAAAERRVLPRARAAAPSFSPMVHTDARRGRGGQLDRPLWRAESRRSRRASSSARSGLRRARIRPRGARRVFARRLREVPLVADSERRDASFTVRIVMPGAGRGTGDGWAVSVLLPRGASIAASARRRRQPWQ